MGQNAERISLYVPPEEYAAVKALGACWDEDSKYWYIGSDVDASAFRRWLPGHDDEEELQITSEQAYVASARVACQQCQSKIEVICIYCQSGLVRDESLEPLMKLTVSNISALDSALERQLAPWPAFKQVGEPGSQAGYFANHCPRCGALQEDYLLHDEPGDPFFSIPTAPPDAVELTPLVGRIQLSGDYHFEV
jgi:hypothetical protein